MGGSKSRNSKHFTLEVEDPPKLQDTGSLVTREGTKLKPLSKYPPLVPTTSSTLRSMSVPRGKASQITKAESSESSLTDLDDIDVTQSCSFGSNDNDGLPVSKVRLQRKRARAI